MSETPQRDVTRLLHEWVGGSKEAATRLMELVYPELHRIAARYLRGERAGHTLQSTALVNEAYLRLAGHADRDWQSRTHFFAVAATVVRRVLVDHARARQSVKRGQGRIAVTLSDADGSAKPPDVDLLDLDAALVALERLDANQSRLVELRYFAGLSIEETAAVLRVSESSVKREWVFAKTWLRQHMLGSHAGHA